MSGLCAFAFGKLPAHGDFVARGLSPAERDAWDAWASDSLETARRDLGEAFEAAHDTAPPWRFAMGPGPLGDTWQAGALTPSIDRSGRRFIIVAGAKAQAGCLAAQGAGGQVAEAMEAQIYRTFETGGDIDALVAGAQTALADLAADPPCESAGRFWTVDPPDEITAQHPPANLMTRALTR